MDAVTFGGITTLYVVCAVIAIRAAYRNGVTDGYGYSRDPNCPGYAAAGEWLKAHMKHRWPELAQEDQPGAVGHTQRRIAEIIQRDWERLNKASQGLLCAWLSLIVEKRSGELGAARPAETALDIQQAISAYLARKIPGLCDTSLNLLVAWLYWVGVGAENLLPPGDAPAFKRREAVDKMLATLRAEATAKLPGPGVKFG